MVCRQLGYLRASQITKSSFFGSVSDVFSYDQVQCYGFESNLDNCHHTILENCGSSEGAGVVCTNDAGEKLVFKALILKLRAKIEIICLVAVFFGRPAQWQKVP